MAYAFEASSDFADAPSLFLKMREIHPITVLLDPAIQGSAKPGHEHGPVV
jgi:hypothetical protein